jgi:hypothetical protein
VSNFRGVTSVGHGSFLQYVDHAKPANLPLSLPLVEEQRHVLKPVLQQTVGLVARATNTLN